MPDKTHQRRRCASNIVPFFNWKCNRFSYYCCVDRVSFANHWSGMCWWGAFLEAHPGYNRSACFWIVHHQAAFIPLALYRSGLSTLQLPVLSPYIASEWPWELMKKIRTTHTKKVDLNYIGVLTFGLTRPSFEVFKYLQDSGIVSDAVTF